MRRRLVLAIAGVASLAVVLFAVPLAVVLQRAHRGEALLRLQRDTVAATRGIDVSAAPGDPVELPDHSGLAVYDLDGRRIAGRGGPASADEIVMETLRDQAPTARAQAGRLTVAVPLVVDERATGVVRAERDDDEASSSLVGQWWLLLGVAAGVIGVAILAALVLGRRLAGPLERVADSARRLGDGDFAIRAPRAGVREVDDVARALDAAAARLDALVSRERAFSADASHQLRTPLAALRLELEALELRGGGSPEIHAALAQVDRLHDTVGTLLAVARDAPRTAVLTPLREVLDEAESRWHATLAADGRSLSVRLDDPGMSAPMSPSVMREIVDVLVDNAIRHGGGTVTVHARHAGGSLAVDVGDEGPGPGTDVDDVFARRSGRPGGHGIGLALARSLAHAEGARLLLSRARPPVFTLFLPDASGDGG